MQGLIDHGTAGPDLLNIATTGSTDNAYNIYFGLGHSLRLTHSSNVFKVSLAGVRLGYYLMRQLETNSSKKSFLDLGTGSGVHALLMRLSGNKDITATDISEYSIEQAKRHEHMNFKENSISFIVSDLFENLPQRQYQTVLFNPPGWRTPSESFIRRIKDLNFIGQMPIQAMFCGESVISRFLDILPRYLAPQGTAIVGLNSLVGIKNILSEYVKKHNNTAPLAYRLIERHTFPLFHYTPHWKTLSKYLKEEFEQWAKHDLAEFSVDRDGNIFWSYEIVEFYHRIKKSS